MVNRIGTFNSCGLNKELSSRFRVDSQVRHETPEEGWRCNILTSTEPSIKRCTCVNKRKNSGSRWEWDNYITRCPRWFGELESVGDKMPKWEPAADRGLWALSDPRLGNPSQDEKGALLWSEEPGSICSSLSSSPTYLFHTTNINPFENKVWEIYFL